MKNTKTVGVVGLGYVGLPLALAFGQCGHRVVGVDVDATKVERLRQGRSPVEDVSDAQLQEQLKSGRFVPTADYAALAEARAISICVPTPLRKSKDPEMSYVLQATEAVAQVLRPDQVIILESTVYPGATEELIAPALERSGLKVGRDFWLAFSPERVDPGNARFGIRDIPKVVGGVTPACTEKAVQVYRPVFRTVVPVASTKEAEMAKLLENTFRSVNIGLINELALVAHKMGIDIWQVIEAAATKPFGFMPFYPGPGLGGHCIPVDPFYLSWKAKLVEAETGFIELAGRVNAHMPVYVVERLTQLLNERGKALNGSKVLVLGVAYKRDVGDVRESPALDVLGLLAQRKARVQYHDPHVPQVHYLDRTWESVALSASLLAEQDVVVLLTDHSAFDLRWIVTHAPRVFDTRNATAALRREFDHIEVL